MSRLFTPITLLSAVMCGCSDEPDAGLSDADIRAIAQVVSRDGRLVVFGIQRVSETEVVASAMPRAAAGAATTQPAAVTEFTLTRTTSGWRVVRQRQDGAPAAAE